MAFEREYRDLSFVPRWVILRSIKQQSVAEHSYYVALYAMQLARDIDWKGDMGLLLQYALIHDAEECFIGDIPGPIKSQIVDEEKYKCAKYRGMNKRFSDLKELLEPPPEDIHALIKLADGLDEVFHLATEMQLGNASVTQVFHARLALLRLAFHTRLPQLGFTSDEAINYFLKLEYKIQLHHSNCSIVVHPNEVAA